MELLKKESKKLNLYALILIIITIISPILSMVNMLMNPVSDAISDLSSTSSYSNSTFDAATFTSFAKGMAVMAVIISLVMCGLIVWFYAYSYFTTKKLMNSEDILPTDKYIKDYSLNPKLRYIGAFAIFFMVTSSIGFAGGLLEIIMLPFTQNISVIPTIGSLVSIVGFVLSLLFLISTNKVNKEIQRYIASK